MTFIKDVYCEEQIKQKTIGKTHWQWVFAIIANLTLLTYGMQSGWVSPTIKYLQSPDSPTGKPLTDSEISWVGSVLGVAAAVGVPVYTFIADMYGRKISIIFIAAAQGLGWVIKFSSANVIVILVARIFCGVAAGGCFVVVPMYVREISQNDIRGLVGSLLILFQNIGFLFMFAIGAYLNYYAILWVVVWLPVVTILLMIKAPESPAMLVKVGKVEEAAKTIAFLRCLDKDNEILQKEIDAMKKEELYFKSLPAVSFMSFLRDKAWRRGFVLMMSIITIHASNGTFAVVTYASSILSASSSKMDPDLQSLSFPAVMILAAFLSMSCVERFGRKMVLAISLTLVSVAMISLASVILMQHQGVVVPGWIPLVAMMISVGSYAFGLSPVPFIMLSEIFNFQIRAKALGFIVTYSWTISSIQLLIFNPLQATIGLHGAFFFFSGVNVIGLFITIVLLPETKGKTVEQIEEELRLK